MLGREWSIQLRICVGLFVLPGPVKGVTDTRACHCLHAVAPQVVSVFINCSR